MMGLPVIYRELRVEAQRPFNYWLRVLGAGVVILLIGALLLDRRTRTAASGSLIFGYLHAGLFVGIWLFVPLLTADCLSLEKREGTLGLLFLTRLTPRSIVGAKAAIQVLRGLTALLAMAPAILLPFLMGGIGWQEALVALGLDLGAFFVALAAGLCASAWCQRLGRSVGLALLLSAVFSALFAFVFAWGFFVLVTSRIYYSTLPAGATAIGFLLTTGAGALWTEIFSRLSPSEQRAWVGLAGQMLLLSLGVFGLAVVVCGQRLRWSWQEVPATLRQLRILNAICAPRYWVASFRRRMNTSLDRNPIGWLQEYSWSARAIKWGWLGVFGVTDTWLMAEQIEGGRRWRDMLDGQFYLSVALAMGMAASAVGSFRRERQNGVLELLLISPLSAVEILRGRLGGIWSQFFPAALLLLVVWWQVLGIGPSYRWMPDFKWFFIATFATLPVMGLWCSLLHRSFVVSWLLACFLGIEVPYFVGNAVADSVRLIYPPATVFGMTAGGIQFLLAANAWRLLKRNLEERTFALN